MLRVVGSSPISPTIGRASDERQPIGPELPHDGKRVALSIALAPTAQAAAVREGRFSRSTVSAIAASSHQFQ